MKQCGTPRKRGKKFNCGMSEVNAAIEWWRTKASGRGRRSSFIHFINHFVNKFLSLPAWSEVILIWNSMRALAAFHFKLKFTSRNALYILLHQHPSSQSTKYLFDFDLRLFPQHRYTYCYNICFHQSLHFHERK